MTKPTLVLLMEVVAVQNRKNRKSRTFLLGCLISSLSGRKICVEWLRCSYSTNLNQFKYKKMIKAEPTREQIEAYSQKLLAKLKQDPYFDLKLEYGRLLMIHIDDFTPQQHSRYVELHEILKDKY